MCIKQVSVFVDNKNGSIAQVISLLGQSELVIKALSVADAADFGILRLIVDDPEKACAVVQANGYKAKIAQTLGVAVSNRADELGKVLNVLKEHDIAVTYIYSVIGNGQDRTVYIIKTPDLAQTEKLLADNGAEIVKQEQL